MEVSCKKQLAVSQFQLNALQAQLHDAAADRSELSRRCSTLERDTQAQQRCVFNDCDAGFSELLVTLLGSVLILVALSYGWYGSHELLLF